MLSALIDLSLENRFLVIVLVGLMAVFGAYCALSIPIDAVPDMTNVQVQVITDAGFLSPLEVEQYVTYPVETAMGGLPRVEEVRSISRFGISVVTVVFEEGVDVVRARQWISERLPEARAKIASHHGEPELGVLSTALGEILQFEVRGDGYSAMELRTLLEWDIAPQLREVAGVTEINSHGGFYKTFEVRIDPDRMASAGVTLDQALRAIEENNGAAGGGYIVRDGETRFVRGQALLKNEKDIEQVVVASHPDGAIVLVKDIGDVAIAPMTRQGAVTRDGRGEIVTGMVIMLLGENSRRVVEASKERLAELEKTLPPGVEIEVIYDRAHLIERTLDTVIHNLVAGGALVIVVLLLLLGSFRAGVVVALAIPLSMLFATNLMFATGISASLMSLGAIDFGLIVDSSVIMIENCIRRLSHGCGDRTRMQVVRDAAIEVRKPTMFGELIIGIVYVPILALQGTEGKLFRPMALTVLFALAGSLVLSLTLMPVLASLALPRNMKEKEPWLIRGVKWLYRPILARVVRHPWLTTGAAIAVVAVSIPVAMNLGAEFMPKLDEGDLLIEANRLPSATIEDATVLSTQIESVLMTFPEVKTVFCKTGRPEIANDVMGVHQTDVWVILRPVDEWPRRKAHDELIEELSAKLNSTVAGASFAFTQPIEMRVDELVAGVKADVAVLLYGDDLAELQRKGKQIEQTLRSIPGAVDVKADYQANVQTLMIRLRSDQLARYGINAREALDVISTIGGQPVGDVYEGRRRFPILVRVPPEWRGDKDRIAQLPVTERGGRIVTIGDIATMDDDDGHDQGGTPPGIEHESSRRRTFVQCNVRGRDVASFVREAQQAVERDIALQPGYTIRWGGDFEHLQTASLRLAIILPVVLLVIWLLLYTSVRSIGLAALIFLAVPMAASGGVFALYLRGMPFSISAGVGFIALFGVAVLNGLVWVSAAQQMQVEGAAPRTVAYETGLIRIRPVLMTALVASLGFLPMAVSTTAGAEIQRPLATVVIGGLITSTLLTALVVPAIYPWFAPRVSRK